MHTLVKAASSELAGLTPKPSEGTMLRPLELLRDTTNRKD